MKTYIDTSVLVAYYCPEPLSRLAEQFVLSVEPVISNLVEVELFSALSRKVRERTLKRADAAMIGNQFIAHLAEGYFERTPIDAAHFQQSRDWLAELNGDLRTLDALHLAVAYSQGYALVTADERLHANALKRKVACELLTA